MCSWVPIHNTTKTISSNLHRVSAEVTELFFKITCSEVQTVPVENSFQQKYKETFLNNYLQSLPMSVRIYIQNNDRCELLLFAEFIKERWYLELKWHSDMLYISSKEARPMVPISSFPLQGPFFNVQRFLIVTTAGIGKITTGI